MTRSRMRAISLALVFVLSALCLPAVAYAGVAEYQVQFAPVGLSGNMDLIVNVVLSPDTKLPAKVRVPLPAGATVLWAGEILGGEPSADPSREVTLTTVGGAQYAELTLSQVRVAQVEAELSPATVSGTSVEGKLDWINVTDAGTYTFSVRIEPKVSDVKILPAPADEPQKNADGESLYTLSPVRLEKNGKFSIDVTYKRGSAAQSSSGGTLSVVLIAAIALLVLAVAALIVVVVRQGKSGTANRPSGPSDMAEPPTVADASSADDDDDEAFTWD